MEKTTLYLPSELHRALYEFARRTGRPVVCEALDAYLRQQDRSVLRSIGSGENANLNAVDTEDWLEANWRPA